MGDRGRVPSWYTRSPTVPPAKDRKLFVRRLRLQRHRAVDLRRRHRRRRVAARQDWAACFLIGRLLHRRRRSGFLRHRRRRRELLRRRLRRRFGRWRLRSRRGRGERPPLVLWRQADGEVAVGLEDSAVDHAEPRHHAELVRRRPDLEAQHHPVAGREEPALPGATQFIRRDLPPPDARASRPRRGVR